MKSTRTYTFVTPEVCEMCHDSVEKHKIMGQRLSQSQGFRPKKKTGITVSVRKCSKCGLIYSYPQPVPESINDHYGIDPEEYSWKEDYFKYDPSYFSIQLKAAKELLSFKEGMKALDIGAGLGKAMRSMMNAGFDAYGIEPSANFRSRSIEWLNIPEEKVQLASAEESVFPENYFDFITFGAVFEHLYHPADILAKATKWLKPGGIIHIEVPSARHLVGRLTNFYFALRGTNYVSNLSPMHAPFHLYEYTYKSFQEVSKRLSLTPVRHYFDVCDIFFGPNFAKPVLRKYMEMTNTGMQLTVYLKK